MLRFNKAARTEGVALEPPHFQPTDRGFKQSVAAAPRLLLTQVLPSGGG